jgi:hypothetical protein
MATRRGRSANARRGNPALGRARAIEQQRNAPLKSDAPKSASSRAIELRPSYMSAIFIEAIVIGFLGTILFVAVDKFEPKNSVANFLKLLVLVVGAVAILHKLGPLLLGIPLF